MTTTKSTWTAMMMSFLAVVGGAGPLRAEEPAEVQQLRRQIAELDQKLRVLERQRELGQEAEGEKARTTPVASLGASGLQVRSADSNFIFRARGYVQVDARFYPGGEPDDLMLDTFLIRRARPIFEGTVFERFDYRVMLDFASQATSARRTTPCCKTPTPLPNSGPNSISWRAR